MHEPNSSPPTNRRNQWLALLEKHEVGSPKALSLTEVPEGLVQATVGEPAGRISLEGVPANILMFNMSPVQALRQFREGRSFVSNVLYGEMTLMPAGVSSWWSWNSSCDRLDVIVSPDVFSDGSKLDVVDRFLFRDLEMETVCRRLYGAVSGSFTVDRFYVESLVAQLADLLLRRHSTVSESVKAPPSGGLTRPAGPACARLRGSESRQRTHVTRIGEAR